ncbi:hypothetical protein [Nostoc sp. FACHB-888]|uniref:hypothetical protein n=1 Tax=Nostoc sp. FACHB-888 TaxID=2692842 RepID=UPI001684F130|nr:hypothetical protein [Nostoc sp. FACHB-888]MBD2247436.1 hypothetical protein [Nostoc sp. FACHB-888]
MTKKKMSGMKLSQFSGIKSQSEPEITSLTAEVEPTSPVVEKMPITSPAPKSALEAPTASPTSQAVVKEKPVTINIKITRTQHDWLTDTARTVRDNNTEAVPPGERVYPQHLIGVAIELLLSCEVDWSQIKNTEDLKQLLNL